MIPVKVVRWAGVAVAVIVAAAVAYMAGYSPFTRNEQPGGGQAPVVAGDQPGTGSAAPEPAAGASGQAAGRQASGSGDAAGPATAGDAPASGSADGTVPGQAPASEVVTPSFGIVRVEPDGSLVVAGSAGAEARVELISGARKLGETKAGQSGDFAIVLDEPLKPGDYQLVLRATETDGRAATSLETAIVAVPETRDGQVLALVEEPGKPSRLITTPAPVGDGGTSSDAAPAGNAANRDEQAAFGEGDRERTATGGGIAPSDTAAAGGQQDQAGDAAATQVAGNAVSTQADEAPAKDTATGQPEERVETAMDSPSATGADASPQPNAQEAGRATSGAEAAQAPDKAARKPAVLVEAVEIEGRRVFVAGAASGGARVRVYANDILLGDAPVTDGGRFLVEATRDLPVGDYIVRADLLAANNADVIARAAVPFQRSEGEAIAAVAPRASQDGSASPPAASAGGNAPVAPAAGSGDRPRDESPDAQQAAGTAGDTAPARPARGAGGLETGGGAATDAGAGTAMADAKPSAAPDAASGMVTAPALEATEGSVIIRRGDTLWQISRRVYGRGVRYSTIYLANQEQISDPDRIWPGQVFRVPDQTPEGEPADMSTVETPAGGDKGQ